MSFKLYEAYRLKKGVKVWDFTTDVRARAQKHIQKRLRSFYEAILKDLATGTPEDQAKLRKTILEGYYGEGNVTEEHLKSKIGAWSVGRWVEAEYRKQSIRYERDVFDLDVSVSFRYSKRRWLIIPFSGSGILHDTLNFMTKDKRLEDYHYQNQSDKSAKCSDREWRRRGKEWDYLMENERFDDQFILEICSVRGFYRLDPSFAMMKEEAAKAKKLGKDIQEVLV